MVTMLSDLYRDYSRLNRRQTDTVAPGFIIAGAQNGLHLHITYIDKYFATEKKNHLVFFVQ